MLWVPTDALHDAGNEWLSHTVADRLAASKVPVIVTGIQPWRPTTLLEARLYTELELNAPSYTARKAMWQRTFPEIHGQQLGSLAARFHMSGSEVRAAAQVARTQAQIARMDTSFRSVIT